MPHRYRATIALCYWFLSLLITVAPVAEFHPAHVALYFSPRGGATDAVVHELNTTKTQVLMQPYGFISVPIAKALIDAHKRGVKILAVLDKTNETDKYSAATFLANASIETLITPSMPAPIPR